MSLEKAPNPGRRKFLQLFSSVVAAGAIPQKLLAAPGYEASPLAQEDLDFFKSVVSDPRTLKRFQEQPTWRQALSVLRVLARVDVKWEQEMTSHEKNMGEVLLATKENTFAGNGTNLMIRDEKGRERFFLVTAKHVVEKGALAPKGRAWQPHLRYDFAFCEIDKEETVPEYGTEFDFVDFGSVHERSHDITAAIGVLAGKNVKQGGIEDKPFPSLVSPMLSPQIIFDAIMIAPKTATGASCPVKGEEVRMIVIPPGEVASTQGRSGAAIKYCRAQDGRVAFGGIVSTLAEQSFGKETFTLAFFVDQSVVRDALAVYTRENARA